MKTIVYKSSAFIALNLITGILMAQSVSDKSIAFKNSERQLADHFTIREIKKKELQISPSTIVILNTTANSTRKEKSSKRKKMA